VRSKIVADTRTVAGTLAVWGASLPAGCLYAPIEFVRKNPGTAQALANAIVRADKWIVKASAEDVARVVPESYLMGDRALYMASFEKAKEAMSPDGILSEEGARATLDALGGFDPELERERSFWNGLTPTSSRRSRTSSTRELGPRAREHHLLPELGLALPVHQPRDAAPRRALRGAGPRKSRTRCRSS
jgi:hypothetical protein